MKGITIGDYAVIGAGSVVRTSIPEKEVWAGNPAVYIKKISK
jgi:acetyltransferase-like isoleucine patch superfamily enzyme